ncbi:MAG: hypothetical protein EBX50_20515 [Chitinophagia bacterium]|nr:hypothetical protein [Chitinophagia bacterium]
MRCFWLVLLGGMAFGGTAEARLGENKEQVIERYGKPLKERVEGDWSSMLCLKDGYKFRIYLLNNKVEMITIKNEDLTEKQVKIFLAENAAGKGFEETDDISLVQTNFVESDTGRRGRWWNFANTLHIESKVAIQNQSSKIFVPKDGL